MRTERDKVIDKIERQIKEAKIALDRHEGLTKSFYAEIIRDNEQALLEIILFGIEVDDE